MEKVEDGQRPLTKKKRYLELQPIDRSTDIEMKSTSNNNESRVESDRFQNPHKVDPNQPVQEEQKLLRCDVISLLPPELSLKIFSYLKPTELLTTALVCQFWQEQSESNDLWKERCSKEGIRPDSLPAPPNGSSASSPCFSRCRWKSIYLRHKRVEINWRSGTQRRREYTVRGNGERVYLGDDMQNFGGNLVFGYCDYAFVVSPAGPPGEEIVRLVGRRQDQRSCRISEQGDLMISASLDDHTLRVWDIASGNCLRTLHGHTRVVNCVALRCVIAVSGSDDATLRVWNIRTGECLRVLTGHTNPVHILKFDGRRAVSAGLDRKVKVWDVGTGSCLHTLHGHTSPITSLKLYSERNIVISGSWNGSILLWELVMGQCLRELIAHKRCVSELRLSGNILISGGDDATIKLWDTANKYRQLVKLAGEHAHRSRIKRIQYLENGLVVSLSYDGAVKMWDPLKGGFIRDICGEDDDKALDLRASRTSILLVKRTRTDFIRFIVFDFNADYP